MADYHILGGRSDGNQVQVVFHLPVPDTTNAVDVRHQAALVMQRGGSQASIVPASLLGAGEQTALDAGELYEYPWQFNTYPGMTLLDKRDILDTKFNLFASTAIDRLQIRLEYYGYNRDVP